MLRRPRDRTDRAEAAGSLAAGRGRDHGGAATTGIVAVALAAALWAVAAVVARTLFEDGVEPVLVAEARAVVAAIGLALLAPWDRRSGNRSPRLPRRYIVALGLSIALGNATYYLAIDHLPVAVAIVLQYTAPALVVGWAALVAGRRPSPEVLVALVAALAGVALVSEVFSVGLSGFDAFGIAMGLASAGLFATLVVVSAHAVPAFGPVGAMRRGFAVAAAFWVLVQVFRGWPAALVTDGHLWPVLYIGVLGTLAPFLLFVWGVGRIASERAAIAATLEPVLAAAAAWLWLGQALSPAQVAGGALVLLGVTSLNARRRAAVPAEEGST